MRDIKLFGHLWVCIVQNWLGGGSSIGIINFTYQWHSVIARTLACPTTKDTSQISTTRLQSSSLPSPRPLASPKRRSGPMLLATRRQATWAIPSPWVLDSVCARTASATRSRKRSREESARSIAQTLSSHSAVRCELPHTPLASPDLP